MQLIVFRDNGENGGKSIVGGISLNDNQAVWNPMCEYGHSGKCFLKHGKSHMCLVGKLECDSFAGESDEQYNNVRIVENEATVKISEAKEGLHILHFLWLGPILNYLNFCLVHGESLRRQNVPKVLYSLRVKLTFVGMDE